MLINSISVFPEINAAALHYPLQAVDSILYAQQLYIIRIIIRIIPCYSSYQLKTTTSNDLQPKNITQALPFSVNCFLAISMQRLRSHFATP